MSSLTFPSFPCSEEAGEGQSVGELENRQRLLEERGPGECCFGDGAGVKV